MRSFIKNLGFVAWVAAIAAAVSWGVAELSVSSLGELFPYRYELTPAATQESRELQVRSIPASWVDWSDWRGADEVGVPMSAVALDDDEIPASAIRWGNVKLPAEVVDWGNASAAPKVRVLQLDAGEEVVVFQRGGDVTAYRLPARPFAH